MAVSNRVLITGINGFIGKALSREIRSAGYDVWGIDFLPKGNNNILAADLLNLQEALKAANKLPPCSVLIHAAALAHNQKPPDGETVITINVKITENVLKAFGEKIQHMVFLSSVAVYGEDRRHGPVSVNDELRSSTEYGISKIMSENLILKSNISNCDILRFAPVFDINHMVDIRKRVFLPGFSSIKIIIKPSPEYSLTSIQTVVKNVLKILSKDTNGKSIYNISDSKPYNQNDLTNWFIGRKITIPVIFFKPFYWLTYLFPKKYGYKIRCYYWKLFRTNVYEDNI